MDWTQDHVRRLFWRAGFGATPEEAARFADAGKAKTIKWLLKGGGGPELVGPAPRTESGRPLDPVNEWGHDVVWWLDRMVRTRRPLVEKMTLFWHDHFGTSDQETPLMLRQNKTLRKNCLGDFRKLLRAITLDSAMQLFLSLADSDREAPNENYARELMELFTLGKGYTERDIREAARALTGFRARWDDGFHGIYYDKRSHDPGVKKIFKKRGRFDWKDVLDLVVRHKNHPPFLVEKLWNYFVTSPLDKRTRKQLVKTYAKSKYRVGPVVGAILAHPALYADLDRPDMVKAPVVFLAGAIRSSGGSIVRDDWSWISEGMGQVLFNPPSVAGWDWGPAWLSTNSMKARFNAVTRLMADSTDPLWVPDGSTPVGLSPADAVARARKATGQPWTSRETAAALERLAGAAVAGLRPSASARSRQERADMRERVLRHLLVSGPDAQLC